MKRRWKIIIAAVVVIAVAAGGIAVWQWGNIKAFTMSRRYSQEELEQLINDSETSISEALQKAPEIKFNPLNEDERKKLREGELSIGDAVAIVTGKTESQTPGDTDTKEPDAGGVEKDTGDAQPADENELKRARIAELVATVYVLRDTFTAQLEAIKSSAEAEYRALPKDQRTSSAKMSLMMRCADEAAALESECDTQINAILSELKTLLSETGGDLTLVNEMKTLYTNEKAVKKAYYLSLVSSAQ